APSSLLLVTETPPQVSEIIVREEDIREYIAYLTDNNLLVDPLGIYLTSPPSEVPCDSGPDDKQGVCIICYSAPEIGGKMYATQLANKLNLEAIDIDELAIDTLIDNVGTNNELVNRIIDMINTLREKIARILEYVGTQSLEDTSPEPQAVPNKKSKRSVLNTSQQPAPTPPLMPRVDLSFLEDMLTQLLQTDGSILEKCRTGGIVIEDLRSQIFPNTAQLFLLLLSLVTPGVKHIHLVVFHDSREAYEVKQDELNALLAIHNEKLLKEKRKRLKSITPEQYAKLSDSDRDIYKQLLEERKHAIQQEKAEDVEPVVEFVEPAPASKTQKRKSRIKVPIRSSVEKSKNEPQEVEPPPMDEKEIYQSQVLSQFSQYEALLSRMLRISNLWSPRLEDVFSLGPLTEDPSTANLARGKKKNIFFHKEPEVPKSSDNPEEQGLLVFITNMSGSKKNSVFQSLLAHYQLGDVLEREKYAQLLESQRNQVPSLHNFWYLRKPSSARQDLNEDTPPEGTLEGTFRKKLRGFCLQSPLLGNERSVSSDIQAMSQDTQERGMALDVSRVSMTASSMKMDAKLSRRGSKSPAKRGKKDESEALQIITPTKRSIECDTKLVKYTIEPYGKLPLEFTYHPSKVGQYEQSFKFVLNNYQIKHSVKCVGVCMVPDIVRNPSVMYPKVTKEYTDLTAQNIFVLKKSIYFLGYVLNTAPSLGNILRQEAEVTIRNASDCTPVTLHFTWKSLSRISTPEDEFGFDLTDVTLQPRETRKLKVWGAPHHIGTCSDQIIYCIDENPSAGCIKLAMNGVKAEFSVEPTLIKFQRSLLYHKYSACIRLMNKSSATLGDFSDEIGMTRTEGLIGPLRFEDIKLTYSPVTVDQKKLDILVHVTDHLRRHQVLEPQLVTVTDHLRRHQVVEPQLVTVVWESFDVAVDLELPHAKRLLDFGLVKFGSIAQRTIKVKNKGVFDLAFSLSTVELVCSGGISFHPKTIFKIEPETSDLLPDKVVDVQITAYTEGLENEILLDKENVISVLVYDRLDKENLIAILPLSVSLQVVTPR
ncbi:hypothetical protein M8J76_012832, partial [Diaphorina citri]